MEITPPEPAQQPRSASRLARMTADPDLDGELDQIPQFSVEFVPPTKSKTPSSTPSKPSKSTVSLPLRDLLILSPSPGRRSTRTRLSDRLEAGDDPIADQVEPKRRCKTRTSAGGLLGSPKNVRRSRRRLEVDAREERENVAAGAADQAAKPRKRRIGGRSKKEKLASSSVSSTKENEGDQSVLDGLAQLMSELIMWKDVAKSSFWFGFGCLFFLTSSLTRGLSFSFFSLVSHLGLLYLGISFLSSTLHQRTNSTGKMVEFKLKEDDILRVARVFLPAINLTLSKLSVLFSGEPSITLKAAVILLIGAEYGHLLTLWRLCAIGFFASFSVPKLYSLYSAQIDIIVAKWKSRALEAWRSCSRKKAVVALLATAFWNLSSIKTRTFAAFISLVILRYFRQNAQANPKTEEAIVDVAEEKLQQALVELEAKPIKEKP